MTDRYLTAAVALLAAHPGRLWPCCEWVARIVRDALDLPHADGSPWWRDANIWDPTRPWSSVTGLLPVALIWWADTDPYPMEAGRVYVCQGWRSLHAGIVGPGDTGHTWLWYATSPTHGVVLDSSTSRGPRLGGVAFRAKLGLCPVCHAPAGAPCLDGAAQPQTPHEGRGYAMPEGRPWAERVAAYPAGIAVALLPE